MQRVLGSCFILIITGAACSSNSAPHAVQSPSAPAPTADSWNAEPDTSGLDSTSATTALANVTVPAAGSDATSQMLASHNARRAKHCAAPLRWSAEAAAVAQRWANGLAARGCVMQHSNGKLGENLAMIMGGTLTPEQVVAMWYDEVAQYDFSAPGFSMQAGHFTQVVWRGTAAVGCGKAACAGGGEMWVCNYDGPGNWEGQFPANVVPAGSNCASLR